MHELTRTTVSYWDEDERLEGYLVHPIGERERPGVLVLPSWLNVATPIRRRADRLAEHGYAVLVADLFGAGVRPASPQTPDKVVGPLLGDRPRFRRRLFAGLSAFATCAASNPEQLAAIGYCLGGSGALELARAGAPLRGVVSLHGMLTTTLAAEPDKVTAAVLVLHGDADPLAPPEHLAMFREEMLAAGVSWEIDIYGGARHAFTGEGLSRRANAEASLDARAEKRSWDATLGFLAEVLV